MEMQCRSVNEAAEAWVAAMLELLKNLLHLSNKPATCQLLAAELRQFKALDDHLRMLLSTRPKNSWEAYHWSLNFSFFLSQLIRRSERLFQHLAVIPESAHCKLAPSQIADLLQLTRLANRLPNLY
jgi:hypothetical protein